MCNLYSITTNQAAIIALFRVINRYVGNLAPMPGVFPDDPAPVVRNTSEGTEMTLMRWGILPVHDPHIADDAVPDPRRECIEPTAGSGFQRRFVEHVIVLFDHVGQQRCVRCLALKL